MAKDFDVKADLTMEEVQAYYRQQRELESTNSVRIAGKVLSTRKSEPKQKMKADENGKFTIPMFGEDGEPLMWDTKHYITLAFEGGQMEIPIVTDWAISIGVNSRILLEGNKIMTKDGVLKDNFYRYTLLA